MHPTHGCLVRPVNTVPKKRIQVECQMSEDVKNLPISHLDFEGNIAVFTVEGNVSDQVLRVLLRKNCSILEVRELK